MAKRHLIATVACALLLAGCGSSSSGSTSTASSTANAQTSATGSSTTQTGASQIGFEGMPIEQGTQLASPGTTGTSPVNSITCGLKEQLAYHIHAHLAVFDNGAERAIPGGIGIPGSQVVQSAQGPVASGGKCIYWLHTHAPDGVIHIESPFQRVYTLGNFFDIWRQPLSKTQVGDAKGNVSVFVNGKPWTKNPRAVPLLPHAVIQINVGDPIAPFHPVSWSGTQL